MCLLFVGGVIYQKKKQDYEKVYSYYVLVLILTSNMLYNQYQVKMNPALFRMFIPFYHIAHNKAITQNLKMTNTIKMHKAQYPINKQISKFQLFHQQIQQRNDPENKLNLNIPHQEEEEINYFEDENTASEKPQYILRRNRIDQRVKTLQYQANNPCEDSFVCEQLHAIEAYTVSIFDGHGGPDLAEYSKIKINNFIDCYLKDYAENHNGFKQQNIGQILKNALVWSYQKLEDSFYQIYEQQLKLGNKRLRNVGTCGITAIVHNDKVYVGNSGDSQGIFIISQKERMRSFPMNDRLSVNNKSERQKLKQKWKDIDDDIIVEEEHNCYYLKGRLQPTRTIGDYYLKKQIHFNGEGEFKGPYLSCTPDIKVHQLTNSHKYMVIASDGVWDVLSKTEVMTSLTQQKTFDLQKTYYQDFSDKTNDDEPYLNSTLSTILQKTSEAFKMSIQELKSIEKGRRRNYHDDITIAVISLQNQI